MRIAAITVTVFGHTIERESDIEGHAHPAASPRQGQTALLTVDAGDAQGLALAPVEAVRPYVMDRWVRPRLLGEDPLRIAMLWHRLYRLQRGSGGMLAERTLSAVEAALFDLAGKVAGQPVWKLLGGERDRVPAYASTMCGDDLPGGLSSPEDYGAFAASLVARGYQGRSSCIPGCRRSSRPPIPGAIWRRARRCALPPVRTSR